MVINNHSLPDQPSFAQCMSHQGLLLVGALAQELLAEKEEPIPRAAVPCTTS